MLEVLLTMIKGMMNPRKGRFLCVFFSVGLHFVCFRVCIVHFLFLIIELFGFVLISLEYVLFALFFVLFVRFFFT